MLVLAMQFSRVRNERCADLKNRTTLGFHDDSAQSKRLHFLKAEKRTETIHRLHDLACQRMDEFASASTGCFNVTTRQS